ncbi:hypothetical protein [Chryseobacterium sp.]|uniref:hypothetical protein n=1 Tax=Chryseobacterium sp. TaxID=1871047 RepID=UPI0028A15764|nr:hypothetical protein [Chryseobacterium sp.]
MKVFNLCMLFICLTTYSCQQKESKSATILSHKEIQMNVNEEILKKQILQGANQYFQEAGVEIPKPEFSQEELKQSMQLASKAVNSSGYRMIDNTDFVSKIKLIFGRTLDMLSTQDYIYVNLLDVCNRDLIKHPNNGVDYNGFYIAKKEKLISPFYYIPELIDYKNEYSNIVKLESEMSTKTKDNDGDNIVIEKWNDLEGLTNKRSDNIQKLTARNKYLFNDSKADFTWLKFNDKIFLESLVKTFGYVKDKNLLAFVLENNYQKQEELEKIVWNRKCGGEFVVNKEVFDLAKNWKTEKRHDFLMYMLFVVQNMKKEFESNNELTFSQKAKVLGLISYYATQIGNIDNTHAYSFFPMLSGKNYDDEFKKNNYYNIPDFKAVYEDTRTGGIDIDNWVQPDFSLNKTKIPNTSKPIIIYDRADFNSFSTEITVKNEIEYLSKISGWDFIRVDGRVGYLPNEQVFQEVAKTERKKHSFLADDEPLPEKKKGFWDRLFG